MKNRNSYIAGIAGISMLVYIIWPYTRFYYYKPIYESADCRLSTTEVELEPGESYKLEVYGINVRFRFESSDFKVVYVDSSGRILALREGTAIIKVKTREKVLKCKVKVVKSEKSERFDFSGECVLNKRIYYKINNKNRLAGEER